MRIKLDEPKCVSAGQCAMVAPDLFDQRDDDGVAIVLNDSPDPGQLAEASEAASVCPAAAIRLVPQ